MTLHDTPQKHGVNYAEATRVWARIAALSFGGPAGQIAVMHRILVDELRWVSEARFLHALNFCMLLPGPEAQQLATYLGWSLHGVRGGVTAGALFVLPGLLCLMALSWIYVLYGHVPAIASIFFGLQCAVLAIVAQALWRVGKRALRTRTALLVAVASFLALRGFNLPFPLVVIAAAAIGWIALRPAVIEPATDATMQRASPLRAAIVAAVLWLLPVVVLFLLFGPDATFTRVASFFSRLAVVSFGGAYAALAYVAQHAVETEHWLSASEMLDGLGMAETTPGPLIMVVQFVGFLAGYRPSGSLLAGTLAGLLTTWVTFAPCFVWIFLGAPYVERLRSNKKLAGVLAGITAAVVGVIASLAVWFALHLLFAAGSMTPDWRASLLTVLALLLLFAAKRGVLTVLAVCAAGSVVLAQL
ncbi:chromate efflux transporter [Roseiterribacter gracilis]|uniref:Chromate transporter n=1 Tax=Roseiterribacter gracilis TaxID=2812848 RepID=A0A8S8X9W8_9PROT|nr:chromate transporter [Rhodospirillales bacterium TMPK1]